MKKWFYIGPLFLCVAGGFAAGHFLGGSHHESARKILYYVDPMHPSYRSSKPGTAPDCGMDLVAVYADGAASTVASMQTDQSGTRIDPAIQQLYGIRVAKAEKEGGHESLRLFGRVAAEETRTFRVDFGADGYVKETRNDAVGTRVAKDQHLAVVYSPEFLAVAGGYLAANERSPSNPSMGNGMAASTQNAASAQARADRLRNLGMSDVQIDEISQNKKLPEDVYIVSPVNGYIVSRSISAGMHIMRQSQLYTVADLSKVWIEAEVFGRDAQSVRVGTPATLTVADQGESLTARVINVLPDVDPVTHAVRVRLEADNPGSRLRPGMFVNVSVAVRLPDGLSIPVDAVLDSGAEKRVFVRTADDHFEPRTVETGWQVGDRVQVVRGLNEGDVVVSSGRFLVDSESRLHGDARFKGVAAATTHKSGEGSAKAATVTAEARISKMNDAMEHRMN